MKKTTFIIATIFFFFLGLKNVFAQATNLPLLQIEALEYEGAFIISGYNFGESEANYTSGTIAYNSANNSIFIAGFDLDGAVGEFSIPALVNSKVVADLNSATILQNFKQILNLTPDSNPQSIDRISGLYVFNNKLIVNGIEYYDAPANNTHTTLVIEDANNINTSAINGYYSLQGEAHAAGWISTIPTEWQTLLGGSHMTGNSSKYAINSRMPMGISAFAFDPNNLVGSPSGSIPTTTLIDFDLSNPLYADYDTYEDANYNVIEVNGTTPPGHTVIDADVIVGENDLWTEISQASYGFIVPGTRTYLTIGSSGGHNSGIGYKPTQSDGNVCGGPCAYDANDEYNYYWLWDVNDLLAVKNGTLQHYDVRPYAFGLFNVPFQTDLYTNTQEIHTIVGGTYDVASNLLYLSVYDGASTGPYDKNPVIVAYSINLGALSIDNETVNSAVDIFPNPANNILTFSFRNTVFESLSIYNSLGQLVKVSKQNKVDISSLAEGVYIVKYRLANEETISKKFIKTN